MKFPTSFAASETSREVLSKLKRKTYKNLRSHVKRNSIARERKLLGCRAFRIDG